jgi:hypothetical protein
MAPTNKDSGVTRMAGAHMFQTVQHPELDTFDIVTIRDILKKRARYLRLVAQNNKADGVNVAPITVVASIDPELLEKLIDMEEIDAESVDDCTDESVMECIESTQERSASVTAEYVKAKVLAMVSLQCQRRIPRYASQRQYLTTICCTETWDWTSSMASRRKLSSILCR